MTNRYWRIARRPEGTDFASALELADSPLAALEDGQIRIRNSHLSMDAGTRMWLSDREDGYQPPLPVGGPMTGLVLGEVIESRAAGFMPGDLVRAFGQWSDISTVDAVMSGAILLDPSGAIMQPTPTPRPKPQPVSCTINFQADWSDCGGVTGVQQLENIYGQALLQLTLDPAITGYDRARFDITYDGAPDGWSVNIGDSITNNGRGGDTGHEFNDAEVQLVDGQLLVYGNEETRTRDAKDSRRLLFT
jgi:hypothetical protein